MSPLPIGHVLSFSKISADSGQFNGVLNTGDQFGRSNVRVSDLNGDGVDDLVVGASHSDLGGVDRGAVWILFLAADQTVVDQVKIGSPAIPGLDDGDVFGNSVANLGDLNGDGYDDIAVAAAQDDDGGPERGAVWVVFLGFDGVVVDHSKISDTAGGFTGTLSNNDEFGTRVATLGDLNGDGVVDIAVGAQGDDEGGPARGAVWILFLDSTGRVRREQKLSSGNLSGLQNGDAFGNSVVALGDRNGDGVPDLAVGAALDDDGGPDRGAIWILDLDTAGAVIHSTKISATSGGFGGVLPDESFFRPEVAVPDLNNDGTIDLVASATGDTDGGPGRGALWVLLLDPTAQVLSEQKISSTAGGFTGALDDGDLFGFHVSSLGDVNLDGVADVGVGAIRDDDGGVDYGALWILHLNGIPDLSPIERIQALLASIEANTALNAGQKNALAVKLNQAITHVNAGRTRVAINLLNAFVNQVEAFKHAGVIPVADADAWIHSAESVVEDLAG